MEIHLGSGILNPAQSGMIGRILASALQAVEPYQAVRSRIRIADDRIIIGDRAYTPGMGRVLVCGFGKASLAMAEAAEDALGDRISGGVIIAKHLPPGKHLQRLKVLQGNHPVPGKDSLASTAVLIHELQGLQENDLVICLISGGGSALFTAPVAGISLEDVQHVNRALLGCGASINEMNTIRKHLDSVKGGGLWRLVQPAMSACLILSDVIGDNLDIIASGPMVADASTFQEAWDLVKKYHLESSLPTSVTGHLQAGCRGEAPETLKPAGYTVKNSQVMIVGSNRTACEAAVRQAITEGFSADMDPAPLVGEARLAGEFLARRAQGLAGERSNRDGRICLVFGGETTVTLAGNGLGGRNLETALASVEGMAGLEKSVLVTFTTDGEDGPTGAAGAVVTGRTLDDARRLDMNVQDYLARNDSYTFFARLNSLVTCGPTGTNVNDLSLVMRFEK